MAHLYHFCALLPPEPYVDLRPAFTFRDEMGTDLVTGFVTLPNCVSSSVRHSVGRKSRKTEHAAQKDAAFQACVALYGAGLLSDNLLPLKAERINEIDQREELPPMIEISEQFNPWADMAESWSFPDLHQTVVVIEQHMGTINDRRSILLTTPKPIPSVRPFFLYWDSNTTFTIRLETPRRISAVNLDNLQLMREITHTILRSTHSDRHPDDRKDFVTLFTPALNEDHFVTWLTANRGRRPATEELHLDRNTSSRGLVRSPLVGGSPHIFNRWQLSSNGAASDIEVECFPLLKRRNFLNRMTLSLKSTDDVSNRENDSSLKVQLFAAKTCTVDLLPSEQAQLSLFTPAILQHVEVLIVADQLRKTVIKDVPFKDIHHVVTAISASSAQWVTNYQRFEFLGDSVLKFATSCHLFFAHCNWHEGYLSQRRNSLVSNSRLARAALDAGLDPFILTRSFTSRRWIHPLISEVETTATGRRYISSKILADVVEALIGAAFLEGGFSAARACINAFLPDIPTQSPNFRSVFGEHPRCLNAKSVSINGKAESLIEYQFRNKVLLREALTHPSCESDAFTESYQRLEFLGDAVLDMIIVPMLFKSKSDLSHGDMTLIKAALANAQFLAFLCMELSLEQDVVNIEERITGQFHEVHKTDRIQLWMLMRHHSQEIIKAQQACIERHQHLRQDIQCCLKQGKSYPWALLAQLNADKFYSDLVESILGAIFVDSDGNLADCQRFAERIGISPYLRRISTGIIDVAHPKTLLGCMTGSDKIEYIVRREDNARGLYQCLVRISDADIVTVGECLSKDEAATRAADAAVKQISSLKSQVNDTAH
jgi:dsRNA-specific ribonuclease